MRSFRGLACAAFLLASPLLIAQHAAKPSPAGSNSSGCRGKNISVMNGQSAVPVCFDKAPRAADSAPGKGVVIYNGNQKETRVFNSSTDVAVPRNLPPVVIGIASDASKNKQARPVVVGISSNASDTQPVVVNIASAGSNAQPVVVGIASSGFQTAGTVAPVAVGVSPRPAKRPPYRPAALDAQ